MKVVKVQFHEADKEYFFLPEFSSGDDNNIEVNDQVVVKTTLGEDIGVITDWADWQPPKDSAEDKNNAGIQQDSVADVKPMLRPASQTDIDRYCEIQRKYPKYLKKCHELIDRLDLKSMKLVDVTESFDENRLTFHFTADQRVDFRELVKELVKTFRKKIRLQQIGVRDAAKMEGDFGPCGLPLCCKSWLEKIGNVVPDYIKDQELSHRGVDRLTGPCARLKCCLRFEEEGYKYNLEHLPKVGDVIKTKAGKGVVKAVHPLNKVVDIEIDGALVAYPYTEGNMCAQQGGCDNCKENKENKKK